MAAAEARENRTSPRGAAVLVLCIFVAVSLSVTYYYTCSLFAVAHPDNMVTFKSFSSGLENYKNLRQEWRPRLFSNFLAGLLVHPKMDQESFSVAVGYWNAIWLLLCCLFYALWDRTNALYLSFGTFAAIYYAFTPLSELHIYPWDMPALFFYVLLYISVVERNALAVAVITILGTGFKETLGLGSMLFLFWSGLSVRKRLLWSGFTLVGAVSTKLAIDLLTDNPSPLFTMTFDNVGLIDEIAAKSTGFCYNLRALTTIYANHPIFVNAGTFAAFLFLPVRDRDDLMWKILGLTFLLLVMVWGTVNESRIFFEMIPISLWAIKKKIDEYLPASLSGVVPSRSAQ
jgi:hypothetical protein